MEPPRVYRRVCAIAAHLRTGRLDEPLRYPMRWMLALHVAILAAIGFVPPSAPSAVVVVPLALIAGMVFELFRKVGDLAYLPVATTGNLVRLVESAHGALVLKEPAHRRALPVHASVVASFVLGALVGALATFHWGERAIWLDAAHWPARWSTSCSTTAPSDTAPVGARKNRRDPGVRRPPPWAADESHLRQSRVPRRVLPVVRTVALPRHTSGHHQR